MDAELRSVLTAILEGQQVLTARMDRVQAQMNDFQVGMKEFRAEVNEKLAEHDQRFDLLEDRIDHLVEKWVEADREITKLRRRKA